MVIAVPLFSVRGTNVAVGQSLRSKVLRKEPKFRNQNSELITHHLSLFTTLSRCPTFSPHRGCWVSPKFGPSPRSLIVIGTFYCQRSNVANMECNVCCYDNSICSTNAPGPIGHTFHVGHGRETLISVYASKNMLTQIGIGNRMYRSSDHI